MFRFEKATIEYGDMEEKAGGKMIQDAGYCDHAFVTVNVCMNTRKEVQKDT